MGCKSVADLESVGLSVEYMVSSPSCNHLLSVVESLDRLKYVGHLIDPENFFEDTNNEGEEHLEPWEVTED